MEVQFNGQSEGTRHETRDVRGLGKSWPLSAGLCLLSSLAYAAVPPFATGITTDRPAGVFIEGVGAAFRPEGKARFSRWTVTDFFDETVASGAWPTNGISLVLPALGPGYYELDADGPDGARGHFAFTVVQDPATRRPPAPDSPYAMMGGAWSKGGPDQTDADLMRLAGQASVRKIYRWEHIEKAPGKFELVPQRSFTQTYADAGIKVCGMIHCPPKWADTAVVVLEMGAFCRWLERELGGAMCAWETFNEPDLPQSVGDGCWNYTAAQKAGYLAYKRENPARLVFGGAFCLDVGLGYDRLWLDNGGAYYADGLNYHTYFPLGANDKWFGAWREMLASYGITDWAIWVTEDGMDAEGNALVKRPGTTNRAHSRDQERLLAEFYAKDQVFKQMNGVNRSYFFILAAYNERGARPVAGVPADGAPVLRLDDEIRHFSGTATYRLTFDCPQAEAVSALDLGDLRGNSARVRVNGVFLGTAWAPPRRLPVPPDVLRRTGNRLEIEYTNVWANRLIGDERFPDVCERRQATCAGRAIGSYPTRYPAFLATGAMPPDTRRRTFSMWNHFTESSRLVPSGLVGPIRLLEGTCRLATISRGVISKTAF